MTFHCKSAIPLKCRVPRFPRFSAEDGKQNAENCAKYAASSKDKRPIAHRDVAAKYTHAALDKADAANKPSESCVTIAATCALPILLPPRGSAVRSAYQKASAITARSPPRIAVVTAMACLED